MKRFLQLLTSLLGLVTTISEARIYLGDSFTLKPEAQMSEELILLVDQANLRGKLTRELLVAARELEISDTVGEDIVAAAQTANFQGQCQADLYFLSESCFLRGQVKGNTTILSRDVQAEKMVTSGNVRVVAEEIFWEGEGQSKAVFWGKKVTLGGKFQDLVISARIIKILPETEITGNLTYQSPQGLILPPGVVVKGKIHQQEPVTEKWQKYFFRSPWRQAWWLLRKGFVFFGLLVPFLLSVWLTPNILAQTTYLVGEKPWHCLLTGLLTTLSLCLAILLSLVIIVTAPVALLIVSLIAPILYLSRAFPAVYVARKVFGRLPDRPLTWTLTVFLGIILFTMITRIPHLGLLINLFCLLFGFGAFVSGRWQLFCRLRQERFI
ncbi:MAG: hypothetical protein NC911_02110 [Candidatus Omnitrophica bacterium]|nr:hypothetical protein [Candidatus Omnitrophota bacterium]